MNGDVDIKEAFVAPSAVTPPNANLVSSQHSIKTARGYTYGTVSACRSKQNVKSLSAEQSNAPEEAK